MTVLDRQSDLRTRAADLFPGGVNSPVRAFGSVGREPLVLEAGEGSRVRDADGDWYLDYVCSYGPGILGHAHPAIVAAVQEAATDGMALGATGPREVELGQRIREAMPSMERLRFVSSGTEAVMSAIRLARGATGRDLVVKFAGGYHGHGDSMLVEGGSGLATLALPGSSGVTAAAAGETIVARFNSTEDVAGIFAAHGGRIAAVIVEPVGANAGVIAPVPGFLESLRDLTAADGALLIFDEVITGFRVARGGAQERYGVQPDLTTLGKIIGGGMPIGAYGGRAELMDQVAPAGPVYQAGTLSGHPLAMAAGCAALDQLTPEVYEQLEQSGATLEHGLNRIIGMSGADAAVARVGSLLTLFFGIETPAHGAAAMHADREAFARFFGIMLDEGVLLPPSGFEAWFISAAHDEADLEQTLEAAGKALAA